MDTIYIGRILHVLLCITQDTSPGTHTPITTTLPTPVLSWCSSKQSSYTVKGHTHTHTHTHILTGSAESSQLSANSQTVDSISDVPSPSSSPSYTSCLIAVFHFPCPPFPPPPPLPPSLPSTSGITLAIYENASKNVGTFPQTLKEMYIHTYIHT